MRNVLTVLMASALVLSVLVSKSSAQGKGMSFSGVSETSVSTSAGAGNGAQTLTYGFEEYANLRMQARIGENAVFYGAVNLVAASGDYALRSSVLGVDLSTGDNYVSMMELERLYFKLKGESVDFDAGLMRLPFGYSSVWGPSDFLNPKNPLKPDARPRAVLGGGVSYYPIEDFKVLAFASTGRDPFARNSGIAGVSADRHWGKASAQLLYAFERSEVFPGTALNPWTHRIGASVKADLALGLVMEALYAYNDEVDDKIDGLSLSAGFDCSFFDAKLILLAEYLYNGAASSTSIRGGGSFTNENYLFTGLTWRFSDFTNAGLALISGLDDVSFTPLITYNQEIFQGVTLTLMAQIPVDRDLLFGDGNRGELGPLRPGRDAGSYSNLESKLKLKF